MFVTVGLARVAGAHLALQQQRLRGGVEVAKFGDPFGGLVKKNAWF